MEKFEQIETNRLADGDVLVSYEHEEIKRNLKNIADTVEAYSEKLEEAIVTELNGNVKSDLLMKLITKIMETRKNVSYFKADIKHWQDNCCYKNSDGATILLRNGITNIQITINKFLDEFNNSNEYIMEYYDKLSNFLNKDKYQSLTAALKKTFSDDKRYINKKINEINQILAQVRQIQDLIGRGE